MNKRFILSIILIFILVLSTACTTAPQQSSQSSSEASGTSEITTTTVVESTTTDDEALTLKVISPYGTPTLSMVKLFVDNPQIAENVSVEYEAIQATDVLTSSLVNQSADIAIVPTNLAANLYQKGVNYRLAGSSVWGVLYLVSTEDISTIADLKGKNIATIGRNLTPDAMLRYVLTENGIDPDNDLSLEYFSGSSELATYFIAGKADTAMIPQPLLASVLAKRQDAKVVIDLQEQWQAITKLNSYPQASLIINQQLLDEHPDVAAAFIEQYDQAVAWVNDNPEKAGEYYESLGIGMKAKLISQAIPQSNLDFVPIADCQGDVSAYLDVLFKFNPKLTGGKPVDEKLYLIDAEQTSKATNQYAFPLTFVDGKGNQITLQKKPETVIPLTGTTMYLYTLTGGQAVAGPSLSKRAPRAEGTPDYAELGHMANINIESLITHEPDLVIMQSMQAKLIPMLEENNIPVMFFAAKTYQEIQDQIKLFASINDNAEKGEEIIKTMDKNIADTLAKLPAERNKKIAIVYVAGSGITLKLNNSIAGDAASIIGFDNITKDLLPEKMGMDSTPFDLEMLVAENPDVIFVTSMVSADDNVADVLTGHLEDSTAWAELDAVKNGNVHYLPQSHFLFNPVDRYDEAVEMMAKHVWPELFK